VGGARALAPLIESGVPRAPAIVRYRRLLGWLGAWVAMHVVAVAAMAVLLAPAFAPTATTFERAAYVAAHPWAWRLGWVPWQLCAVIDLGLSFALYRWLASREGGRGRASALAALAVTAVAVVPDQWGEAVLSFEMPALAAAAVADASLLDAYRRTEAWALLMTSTCGGTGYLVMTVGWIAAVARAGRGLRLRVFVGLGLGLLVPFLAAAWLTWAEAGAADLRGLELAAPINAVAFGALLVWGLVFADALGRIHRADHPAADDAAHRLVWPRARAGRLLAGVAASAGVRDLARSVPWVTLVSDIRDVVYLNWLVPTERVAKWLPEPLRADTLDGLTAVSILTYTHGDFGPAFLGPLRRALPSPAQSNWRLYLEPPAGGPRDAIYFFKTVLSSPPHVLLSRVLADGLPAQLAERFEHRRDGARVSTVLEPGGGGAPDLRAAVIEHDARTLPQVFAERFGGWEEAVRYLVEQNRAVCVTPTLGCVLESRIDIPIAVADVVPARVDGTIESAFLAEVVAGAEPFAFVVPKVAFRALGEGAIA
jgi:hypothetical protein